ncbi:MAG TPA: AMP-binding protein [Acidimicrobiales bacterium]|nr:AMP-binding protein [Acidimicrobiales bacterium]
MALVMSAGGETRTYRQLDEASARLALVLRDRGLRPGDHLAVLLDNEPVFFEAVWAGLRAGLYVTPINWHLAAAEAGYIVADCGATALVTSARLGDVVDGLGDDLAAVTTRLVVGGELDGFEPYEDVVSGRELDAVPEECEGSWMFYSSGTTGRPKGIVPPGIGGRLGAPSPFTTLLTGLFGFTDETVYLSPAPLYHAAPRRVDDDGAAARRHRRGDGTLRPGRVPGPDRAPPRHPHAGRPHAPRPPAQAPRA